MDSQWRAVKVSDVVRLIYRYPSFYGFNRPSSGIPVIRGEHLIENGEICSDPKEYWFVSKEDSNNFPKTILEEHDIVMAVRGTVGKFSRVRKSHAGYQISPNTIRISPDPEKINPSYMFFALQHSHISSFLLGSVATSAVPGIRAKDIKEAPLLLPPMKEQVLIADFLSLIYDKIKLHKETNETLEGIAKALFKSWFVDFDPVRAKAAGRPTGLPDEISELFPDSFEESELGEIPSGWHQTDLGKEANLLTGFPFQSALFADSPPGVRLARGMNVKEGVFFWDSQSRFWRDKKEEFNKYFLDIGDVLIGMDGSKVGKNWVRVRESDLPCLLVQRVARLRRESSIGETFLRFLIGNTEFYSYVDLVKTGTSIPHISLKQIKEYSFIRPEKGDNRLFDVYEDITSPMTKKVDYNFCQSIVLESLRNALLPRLISGEIRVPDAEKMLEEVGI